MKKFVFFLLLSLSACLMAPAQEKQPHKKTQAKTGRYVKKADGTPDMRYKSNKEMVKKGAKGPLKKDGTPDKRYKANHP